MRTSKMEADDGFLVVIVGDKEDSDTIEQRPIKEEVLDDDEEIGVEIEDLIERAEKHGQVLSMTRVKQEPQDPVKLECFEEVDDLSDKDYVPLEEDQEEDDDYQLFVKDKKKLSAKKYAKSATEGHRYKLLKPNEQRSFVRELREQYEELDEDRELLIDTLCEIMKSQKPPPPPQDYFMMNETQFECIKCSHLTDSLPAAGRHWQEKHGERYLNCFACGVDFRSKTNLYKHEKRCSATDAVVVLKARALFLGRKGRSRPFLPSRDILQMRDEIKAKMAKKTFQCTLCSAQFKTNTVLQSHLYAHSGARPFPCPHCPAAYTSRSALMRHYIKHTGVKFICEICDKALMSRDALTKHMDTHREQKKFECELCGRRYAQKMALKLHFDKKHLNLPPPCACQICPKRYPRMSILRDHMLKEHGMNLITKKMFYKSLPLISSNTKIPKAKIVTKSELEFRPDKENKDYEDVIRDMEEASNNRETEGEQINTEDSLDHTNPSDVSKMNSKHLMNYVDCMREEILDPNTKYVILKNVEITEVDGVPCMNDESSQGYEMTEFITEDVEPIDDKELTKREIKMLMKAHRSVRFAGDVAADDEELTTSKAKKNNVKLRTGGVTKRKSRKR